MKLDLSNIKKIKPDKILEELYNFKYKVNEQKEKNIISNLNYKKFPLFDIHSEMIFLIEIENLHDRIINHDYRFPDEQIIEYIKKKINYLEKELKKDLIPEDNFLILAKLDILNKVITFIDNFNLEVFKNNFINIYNKLGESKYYEYTSCVRPSYTNLIPNMHYIKPYFTQLELEKSKIIYEEKNDDELCKKIYIRDVPISILLKHQRHIIENEGAGILQYYSLIGSYNLNNYLRELDNRSKYKNKLLDGMIEKFWNIIVTSPPFEESFYIYRFITNDSFLENLKVGDIYKDSGFLSCTRDPFYTSSYYNFGNNVMKIKVPKNKIGVGLCLELFSYFGKEQEILLAPNTSLKLINKDSKVKYEHTSNNFNIKMNNKYEFEIVDIIEPDMSIYNLKKENPEDKYIDGFFDIEYKDDINDFYEEIKTNYLNEINQVNIKINNKFRTFTIDKVKIYSSYSEKLFYRAYENDNPPDEIIIYYIDNNQIIAFIEIIQDIETKKYEIYVNSNNTDNYVTKRILDYFDLDEFVNLLDIVGKLFQVEEILFTSDFIACEYFKNPEKLKSILEDYKDIRGGNFNKEIYDYFKSKGKQILSNKYILNGKIEPFFDFSSLNKYFELETINLLDLSDSIELKEIYLSLQKLYKKKLSVSDFYIYLKENKCYLINEFNYIISKYEILNNTNKNDWGENMFFNPFYLFHVSS